MRPGNLTQRTVLVTGGTRGIGRKSALGIAGEGGAVLCLLTGRAADREWGSSLDFVAGRGANAKA